MGNENPGGQNPPSGAPGTPPPSPSTGNPPAFVTKEELEGIVGKLDSRLQTVSDALGGINNLIKKVKPPDAPPPEPDQTLTARVKRIEEISARQRERERLNAVRTSLIDGGVPAKKAEREARLILMDHASKIEVNDEDFAVTYRESEEKATPISEWVGAFLKTDDGKALIPPKATNAGVEGGAAGSGQQAGIHPFAKLSFKEIMDSPRTDLQKSFRMQFPAEWEAKKKTYQETGK